ncbi:hypothetical protein SAMN05421693_1074 [Ectothiorhodospira magna]|uniref:HNH endonuclease n=1 Tax=Ectothiorhodospira magna TaxID=867345 RepID=A0A1H9AXJ8_9GAMM|nr:hypothetical protein SAMN05421693_1074 [Ectothiorhodospira magna]
MSGWGRCRRIGILVKFAISLNWSLDTLAEAVQAGQRPSLKDTAAINATRNTLAERMQATGLPVEYGTCGQTKYNRTQLGYPKGHWIDAACLGASGEVVRLNPEQRPLTIKATGHGKRQHARLNRFGFPRGHKPQARSYRGFRTGDQVKAVAGKAKGCAGRASIRFRPCFVLQQAINRIDGIHPRDLIVQQRSDGYTYV